MGWYARWNAKKAAKKKAAKQQKAEKAAKAARNRAKSRSASNERGMNVGEDTSDAVATTVSKDILPDGGGTRKEGSGNEREKFFKEMSYEGYQLLPKGKAIEKSIASAYLPKYPQCYNRAISSVFGGGECGGGIFWVKTKRNRVTPQGSQPKGEKGAESFRFNSETTHYDPRTRA